MSLVACDENMDGWKNVVFLVLMLWRVQLAVSKSQRSAASKEQWHPTLAEKTSDYGDDYVEPDANAYETIPAGILISRLVL